MKIDISSHVSGAFPLRRWVFLLLSIDGLLIVLFLLWAIAGHYDLRNLWVFGRDEFSLGEGRLTEQWGYLKLAAASVIAIGIAVRRHVFFWGLALLLIVMLADDALAFHEQINLALHNASGGNISREVFDLFTKLAMAAVPLGAMAIGFWSAQASERRRLIPVIVPVMALGIWVSVVDYGRSVLENYYSGGQSLGTLIEEGGEGILISATLLSVWHCQRHAKSQLPSYYNAVGLPSRS